VRNEPPHGYQTAVVSIHQRFHEKPRRLHLDGSRLCLGAIEGHDDETVGRRPVDLRENNQREDVCVGSVNASTRCQGRRGGERDKGNGRPRTFVREQQGALDALASSSSPRKPMDNMDNENRRPEKKAVSKERTVLTALSSSTQVAHSLVFLHPTRVSSPPARVGQPHLLHSCNPERSLGGAVMRCRDYARATQWPMNVRVRTINLKQSRLLR
jgi:hypothetical protein